MIDYDRDIKPYQFISICAGVDSDKNVFIDNLAPGKQLTHTDGRAQGPRTSCLFRPNVPESTNSLQLFFRYGFRVGFKDLLEVVFTLLQAVTHLEVIGNSRWMTMLHELILLSRSQVLRPIIARFELPVILMV